MTETLAFGISVKGRRGAATAGSDARTRRIEDGDACAFRGDVEAVEEAEATREALTIGFVRFT